MTLELTTSWVVRGGCETSAEIAKYRLKGILYWDRQNCPAWRWVKVRDGRICGIIRSWMTDGQKSAVRRTRKPRYRWERRK